jgi:hypothetical protein
MFNNLNLSEDVKKTVDVAINKEIDRLEKNADEISLKIHSEFDLMNDVSKVYYHSQLAVLEKDSERLTRMAGQDRQKLSDQISYSENDERIQALRTKKLNEVNQILKQCRENLK